MRQKNIGRIGGIFPPEPLPRQKNGWTRRIAGRGDDLRHMMSGRCGIMLAIRDRLPGDARRMAYLPAYTCETVSGCFVKSGYRVMYYDVTPECRPLYDRTVLDEISLFLACGYYGFSTMDESFAADCRGRGIGVIFDATHSAFSEGGISPSAHYVAASLPKWFPVACGGIALKRDGAFVPDPASPHPEHLALRHSYLESMKRADAKKEDAPEAATGIFWDAETLLREIYGV